LPVCLSVVNRHGGSIKINSKEGKGTSVLITLPAYSEKAVQKSRIVTTTPINLKEFKSKMKILVMDDDREVLKNIQRILESFGCEVKIAIRGEDAVRIFNHETKEGRPFDRVILDLTIVGGMSGVQTLEKLLKIDQQVTAWISSGYFEGPVMAEYEKHGFKGVLKKPYTSEELATTVLA
jgi:CheY-like chemotaxis protein